MLQPHALMSVTDKTGIVDLALVVERYMPILSTGGTYKTLVDGGIRNVFEISAYTGLEEMMNGRLKTLHPKIFGGILARPQDVGVMAAKKWSAIDLVVVNLYAFEETVAQPGITFEQAVEQIDIGGPSLLRAAAKNYERTTVVCEPTDYAAVRDALEHGGPSWGMRRRLAQKVFHHTARYDAGIATYFDQHS